MPTFLCVTCHDGPWRHSSSAAQWRRGRRLRAAWRHEQQSTAQAVAAATHQFYGDRRQPLPKTRRSARRTQHHGERTLLLTPEFFELSFERGIAACPALCGQAAGGAGVSTTEHGGGWVTPNIHKISRKVRFLLLDCVTPASTSQSMVALHSLICLVLRK